MSDARTRLRQLGQVDLGAWVEAATGNELWSIQREIAQAASEYRARVTVPSCFSSGKTYLAARLALAFFDAYTPGTPCAQCGGPCGGAKVITTASKFDHLRTVLWGEIRSAFIGLKDRGIELPGKVGVGQTLRIDAGPDHFIIGQSASRPEGFQGYHGSHILILGDEATAIEEEAAQGLTGILASGDARLVLIFNPTTADTWAAAMTRSERTKTVKIRAWDTPNFTNEDVPRGAYLLTPDFLEDLKSSGMGPGTYDWQTKIEAEFWDQGDDTLILPQWVEAAMARPGVEGTRQLGIDMASYGSDENVIAVRDGNELLEVAAFPSMRQDVFWETVVTKYIRKYAPHYVVYDADGVGAGVIGYAEKAVQANLDKGFMTSLIPFRGAMGVSTKFTNARSAWWWNLRRQFEEGGIAFRTKDSKLEEQLTGIRYSITAAGDIRIETKEEMRKSGRKSPDRADAVMYAWSLSDSLPVPGAYREGGITEWAGVKDRSLGKMFDRDRERVKDGSRHIDDDWL